MKICRNGDVMIFTCKSCGCVFAEAVSKTRFANEAIWDPDREDHGARLECPECGNDAIGFRRKEIEED